MAEDSTNGSTEAAAAASAAAATAAEAAAATEAAAAAEAAAKASPWDDPVVAKAEIERLRKENGSDRVNAKAQAATDARQQILKDLGLIKDDEVADPAKIAAQLAASGADARQARVELAVYRAAGTIADPGALLDSTSFLVSLKDIDPADSAAVTAAITAAVESNPRLGAASEGNGPRAPRPDPSQGSGANGRSVASPAAAFASLLKSQLGSRG
jgi:hypothetical protein